jgi:hypothetical protein
MVAVQLGGRFFYHYYLLWLPPVALLLGYAMHAIMSVRTPVWLGWLVCVAATGDVLMIFVPAIGAAPPWLPWAVLVFAVWCLIDGLYAGKVRFGTWLRQAFAAAMLAILMLPWGIERILNRDMPPELARPAPETDTYLATHAQAGDRLFVWGWLPQLYCSTRMSPGSRVTVCNGLVGDLGGKRTSPRYDEGIAAVLMEDLEQRPPRFVVDATPTMGDKETLYRMDGLPMFAAWLKENYRLAAQTNDGDVYERR